VKAVYFNTHATLTEYHARLCMQSLANQSNDYKWDYFFVYNSHSEELSNDLLFSIFNENNLGSRFKNFKIITYNTSNKKTNLQDFMNLIEHCKNNFSTKSNDYILYLKSEYVLSHKFMESLNKFDNQTNFIFSAMTENAKEYIQAGEIMERAKRDIFTLVDDVTYYAGSDYSDQHPKNGGIPKNNTIDAFELKVHWNDDPNWFNKGFSQMKLGPNGITEPFNPQIRFISHACRGDVNVHYMPADIFINTSLENSKHHTWGYWQGWNKHIENGVRMLNVPEAFGIHVFHDIVSKNRLEPRNDPNKIINGQRY
jgi:hypothetical protein